MTDIEKCIAEARAEESVCAAVNKTKNNEKITIALDEYVEMKIALIDYERIVKSIIKNAYMYLYSDDISTDGRAILDTIETIWPEMYEDLKEVLREKRDKEKAANEKAAKEKAAKEKDAKENTEEEKDDKDELPFPEAEDLPPALQ